MATFAHDMPWGAQIEDGCVRFRLWAPRQHAPQLILESEGGERNFSMQECGGGWFELRSAAARAGSRYCYALDEGLRVPDPASRFQADDVHGASMVVDPRAHEWREPPWRGRPWRETVLYEAQVGAFGASGDYDGLRRRLDTLVDLGITALELMPIAHFEGRRGWGYDGVLLFAPQPAYGSVTQLKRLVDAAHERELMMFLDVVYNHFGPSGNYLGHYAPEFFTDRYCTPWGEAIDFSRREVRDFYLQNALYWLEEYRFDGLRLDAVDHIHDASAKHILVELAETVRERIRDREVHLVLE
ncbi:MAG TPA: alpha-amylase family glycosyl hydrolase, partial [Gammaproteobacteria bacterium]|nr:alpha-amylase family glycosyl hydrolase [Gammaproteobacteria bacterium]